MTDQERYYWDLNGHLVVRNVLTKKELKAANDAIDAPKPVPERDLGLRRPIVEEPRLPWNRTRMEDQRIRCDARTSRAGDRGEHHETEGR